MKITLKRLIAKANTPCEPLSILFGARIDYITAGVIVFHMVFGNLLILSSFFYGVEGLPLLGAGIINLVSAGAFAYISYLMDTDSEYKIEDE